MLSQRKTKPHRVKWVEAERELAIRGVVWPPYHVNEECFSWPKGTYVPQIVEEPDSEEAGPDSQTE